MLCQFSGLCPVSTDRTCERTRDTTHPWDTTTEAAFCALHNHYLAVKMKVHVREALRVDFCFICTLANLQRLPG